MTALITLTTAGADTGPYNLYSDVDGYLTPFETGITKSALLAGYTSTLVPNGSTTVRIMSNNINCNNYIDITVIYPTTTTTSTLAPVTTTTTTTSEIITTTTTTLPPPPLYEAFDLSYDLSSGETACASVITTTYYAVFGSFVENGTILYIDPDLTITVDDGFYSDGVNYYETTLSLGTLSGETVCGGITTTTTTLAPTTTTTTTSVPATTTTTTTGIPAILCSYLIEGVWEVDDPVHPGGGSITYTDSVGDIITESGLWITDSFNITASNIGPHPGVSVTLIECF